MCVQHPWVRWHTTIRLDLQLVSQSCFFLALFIFILSLQMFHFPYSTASIHISVSEFNISAKGFQEVFPVLFWHRVEQCFTDTIIYVGTDACDGFSENVIMPWVLFWFFKSHCNTSYSLETFFICIHMNLVGKKGDSLRFYYYIQLNLKMHYPNR